MKIILQGDASLIKAINDNIRLKLAPIIRQALDKSGIARWSHIVRFNFYHQTSTNCSFYGIVFALLEQKYKHQMVGAYLCNVFFINSRIQPISLNAYTLPARLDDTKPNKKIK